MKTRRIVAPTSISAIQHPDRATAAQALDSFDPVGRYNANPFIVAGALLCCLGAPAVNAEGISCGEPDLTADTTAAVMLWEDCGTGQWHVRATAGGSWRPMTFEGRVTSDRPFTSVDPVLVESGDLLDLPTNDQIEFKLNVRRRGQDGLDFMFPENSDVCLKLETPDTELLVGADRTPVGNNVNLTTLRPCDASIACGAPQIDQNVDAGLWLWRDCESGNWEMRATGGGSDTFASYGGSFSTATSFTGMRAFNLEKTGAYEDVVEAVAPNSIHYNLNVIGRFQDGFTFGNAGPAGICLHSDSPGSTVFVGPDATPAISPFNLADLGSCGIRVVQIPPVEDEVPPPDSGGDNSVPPRHAYLEDGETVDRSTYRGRSLIDEIPFPRVHAGQVLEKGDAESSSKYDGVAAKGYALAEIGAIQAINPNFFGLRLMSVMAYQDYKNNNTCSSAAGLPFSGTGPSTTGCNVFAGHWMYRAGTKLVQALTAGTSQLPVQDASNFAAGEYVVIYDAPAGSFRNAEHARITAVSRITNTLTVARGYKSTAVGHAAGAIVAAHVTGNGVEKRLWAWNQSTSCPRDGSGRRLNQVLADWLAANYDKDGNGNPVNAIIDGVLFDCDFHFLAQSGGKNADVDNDLVMDEGVSPTGVNLWGNGMESFYANVRARLPDALIVGGVARATGFLSNNGTQMEGFPGAPPFETVDPDYSEVGAALSRSRAQLHHGAYGPRYVETMFKHPTLIYPEGADKPPTTNATFRFSFGMTLLEGGFFGQKRDFVADPWFDEYAVDVEPGSSTFGHAIASNPNNESLVRQHRHWLGFPLGPRERVYDSEAFAPRKSLLLGGDFESGIEEWTGTNVNVAQDRSPAGYMDGTSGLHAGPQIRYGTDFASARISGPRIDLTEGKEYTLVFAARTSEHRLIRASVGGISEQYMITPEWTRNVMTFTATQTRGYRIAFDVGMDSTPVWIDSVYLFEGNADVFRRDFEGGAVVVNATARERVVELDETMQRIRGTGQDPINNGAKITTVRIAPWDAAILVRLP